MNFEFVPMTLNYADRIRTWKYSGYIKEIYMDPYFESYNQTGKMRGPEGCEGFAVLNEDGLVGLFEYYLKDGEMEIGLALKPELTGKGSGKEFVIQGVNFGVEKFDYRRKYVRLKVNRENKAAIRVYKKAGFKEHIRIVDEIEMRKWVSES